MFKNVVPFTQLIVRPIPGLPEDFWEKICTRAGPDKGWDFCPVDQMVSFDKDFNPAQIGFIFNMKQPRVAVGNAEGEDEEEDDDKSDVKTRLAKETASELLDRWQKALRVPNSVQFNVKLAKMWQKFSGVNFVDREFMLDALSRDFRVSPRLVTEFMQHASAIKHKIIYQMLGSIEGGADAVRAVFVKELPKDSDLLKFRSYAGRILNFTADNPTGSYSLDLSSFCDWTVAQNILFLNRWESLQVTSNARKCKFGPPKWYPSRQGNRSNFRLEVLNGHAFQMTPVFSLPTAGNFEFHYISSRRPPGNAIPLLDDQANALWMAFFESGCLLHECQAALEAAAPKIFLSCMQLRRFLMFWHTKKDIAFNIVTKLCFRTVDWYLNEKVVRSWFSQSYFMGRFREFMGSCVAFPYVQVEGCDLAMDFRYHEDRLVLWMLMNYENREEGENLSNVRWDLDYDGDDDDLPMGIPRSWEHNWPQQGFLQLVYYCAPQCCMTNARLAFCAQYGLWNVKESAKEDERETLFWQALDEVPVPVVEAGLTLLHRFDSLAHAFRWISHEVKAGKKNTVLNLNSCRARLTKLGLRDGRKGEYSQVKEIFRFIDRSGEGIISWAEFKVMNDLWQEIVAAVDDFMLFMRLKISSEYCAYRKNCLAPDRADVNAVGDATLALQMLSMQKSQRMTFTKDEARLLERSFGTAAGKMSIAAIGDGMVELPSGLAAKNTKASLKGLAGSFGKKSLLGQNTNILASAGSSRSSTFGIDLLSHEQTFDVMLSMCRRSMPNVPDNARNCLGAIDLIKILNRYNYEHPGRGMFFDFLSDPRGLITKQSYCNAGPRGRRLIKVLLDNDVRRDDSYPEREKYPLPKEVGRVEVEEEEEEEEEDDDEADLVSSDELETMGAKDADALGDDRKHKDDSEEERTKEGTDPFCRVVLFIDF